MAAGYQGAQEGVGRLSAWMGARLGGGVDGGSWGCGRWLEGVAADAQRCLFSFFFFRFLLFSFSFPSVVPRQAARWVTHVPCLSFDLSIVCFRLLCRSHLCLASTRLPGRLAPGRRGSRGCRRSLFFFLVRTGSGVRACASVEARSRGVPLQRCQLLVAFNATSSRGPRGHWHPAWSTLSLRRSFHRVLNEDAERAPSQSPPLKKRPSPKCVCVCQVRGGLDCALKLLRA